MINQNNAQNSNYCVCCGKEIPEGTQICKSCAKELHSERKQESV